jgi:hypothetical protein
MQTSANSANWIRLVRRRNDDLGDFDRQIECRCRLLNCDTKGRPSPPCGRLPCPNGAYLDKALVEIAPQRPDKRKLS